MCRIISLSKLVSKLIVSNVVMSKVSGYNCLINACSWLLKPFANHSLEKSLEIFSDEKDLYGFYRIFLENKRIFVKDVRAVRELKMPLETVGKRRISLGFMCGLNIIYAYLISLRLRSLIPAHFENGENSTLANLS